MGNTSCFIDIIFAVRIDTVRVFVQWWEEQNALPRVES